MTHIDAKDQAFLKGLTLLYVEDEEEVRIQFVRFLSRLVGKLLVACDGEEGLAIYHDQAPHMILTDILMPVRDGLEMAREIRTLDRKIPIILLTAFEQVDYLKKSINIGVDKYVTKPVDGLHLQQTLLECACRLRLEDDLQSAAQTDPLTGLANRRELMSRFKAEGARVERHGGVFSLLLADVDHFKAVNDNFGHLAGDRVLKRVAEILAGSVRAEDVCGRWGGEEFLLLLANTDREVALLVAEKLRLAVAELVTPWEGRGISVTLSFGVGAYLPGMSLEDAIGAVDAALYRAKANGRNRCEAAPLD
ncbi:diguanylate cyclase [Trichloromonas sp.]|uniref:diguanylate cyclase n=1 Tax=Trichloromonas sp. TaxID=3069249 RepID=UPI002A438C91|nr:diguanylate cyclase [Trichloromonas sp.]